MKRSAVISDCGRFRFRLSREWSAMPRCAWLMLNPSTADAEQDDPTIRRIVKFADAWGYGAVDVVNLFPFRASRPATLWDWLVESHTPTDLEAMLVNAGAIAEVADAAALRVVAFGAEVGARQEEIARGGLTGFRDGAVCLGTNAAGWPLHPMARGKHRVPDNVAPRFWTWPGEGRAAA